MAEKRRGQLQWDWDWEEEGSQFSLFSARFSHVRLFKVVFVASPVDQHKKSGERNRDIEIGNRAITI
jgi:hypothetical protein